MMDKVLAMLQLQQQLNDATNGENWEEGVTKNGKSINWKRCIYMECAEMVDSFAWKHWKSISAEPDFENLQIEVVDVWHFVMSLALETFRKNRMGDVVVLAQQISDMDNYALLYDEREGFASEKLILIQVESVMRDSLEINLSLTKLLFDFFELVRMSNLDINTLYRLYVGKNILNQFRQDNGYKDGSYIKIWNGEEDNLVMKRIWEESGELKPEALYKALQERYSAL
jgi:dimeric dUTPase (all-alpha-NTP-PPase superfamily)